MKIRPPRLDALGSDGPLLRRLCEAARQAATESQRRFGGVRPFGAWLTASGTLHLWTPPPQDPPGQLLELLDEVLPSAGPDHPVVARVDLADVDMEGSRPPLEVVRVALRRMAGPPIVAYHPLAFDAQVGWWFETTKGGPPFSSLAEC